MEKFKIVIINDTTKNTFILKKILEKDYDVYVIDYDNSIQENIKAMQVDMILLGVKMPYVDGYELCRLFKSNANISKIPVVLFATRSRKIDIAKGIEIGAVDYLQEPYKSAIVKVRVNAHLTLYNNSKKLEAMVQERTNEIQETRLQIIRKLCIAAEYKDRETRNHIIRMSRYCYVIAKGYGLSEEEAQLLLNAAAMHDIGKIGIPDSILLKPGPLNTAERDVMMTHCEIGANIIGKHDDGLLAIARCVAMEHHERFNGKGYPQGIKGKEICVYGRIAAVADVFDALTSRRPYKGAWESAKAINHINEASGSHFDPDVVNAFNRVLPEIMNIKQKFGAAV